MRVSTNDQVFTAEMAFSKMGLVLADADDRQGYFWMRFGIWATMWSNYKPTDRDICIPFRAVARITSANFSRRSNVHLSLTADEVGQLPQRWQVEPRAQVVQQMAESIYSGAYTIQPVYQLPAPQPVYQLPATTGSFPAASPAPPHAPPAPPGPSFAEARALEEAVVTSFSQKAALIREIAKIQAAAESEQIPDTLKQILAKEAEEAYARMKTITEQMDLQMGAYLSQTRR